MEAINKDDNGFCTHLCSSKSCNCRHLKPRQVFTRIPTSSSLFWAAEKQETELSQRCTGKDVAPRWRFLPLGTEHTPDTPSSPLPRFPRCFRTWDAHEPARAFTATLLQPAGDPAVNQPLAMPRLAAKPANSLQHFFILRKRLRKRVLS